MKKVQKRPARGKFFLCGAGIDFLDDMTLGTVRVLRSCDVVFYIHKDRERVTKTLKLVSPGLRIAYADYESIPQPALWRLIEAELKKGRRVAYLAYGNPLLFSEGGILVDYCRRHGYAFSVVPALSSADNILGVLEEHGKRLLDKGFSVCKAEELRARPGLLPPAGLLIIFCASEALKKYGKELFAPIERCYPADHPVYLVRVRSAGLIGKTSFRSLKVKDLRAAAGLIEHRMSIILPALPAGRY
ncbi:MAG: SAM-dependent methyltransferase [Elusimicrobia bacterium]|nr:SAM-dependent methyltransferase [Elusimicrobiota bacterium]